MNNSAPSRAALIGLGMVSATFAQAIANSKQVRLAKILARSEESQTNFLNQFPELGAQPAASIDDIAGDPQIDFIILATPPNARLAFIKACANAGKPVLMEKPVERDLKRAAELVELCEAANLPLGIVLQHRARPIVAELKQLLPRLGQLHAVEINVPWWRPQSYYDVPGRGTLERDGGGVLISQAIHTLDLALHLAGPVRTVTAMTRTTQSHTMEAEDFVSAGLIFEHGAAGQLFATTASFPGRGETIKLHGAHGSVELAAGTLSLHWRDGSSETIGQQAASGAGADPMAFTSDWHQTIIEDFADAIAHNRPPMVTGRDALCVHRLIDAITLAGQSGRTQTVNGDQNAV